MLLRRSPAIDKVFLVKGGDGRIDKENQ